MVGILSIGTELTTGQILNSNVQWISSELLNLGIQCSYQITVPDNPTEMKDAFSFLDHRVSVIIVTGGLGPTADDFTRRIVSEVYERPLLWNEENWNKVQKKLKSRNVQIRSIHRQQCEFPEGSLILSNEVGIADGFVIKLEKLSSQTGEPIQLFILPGPPNEMKNIWQNHIQQNLNNLVTDENRWIQKIWTTKGLPESEVASLLNEALGPFSSQLQYRAHTPYIDVKLLYKQKDASDYESYGEKISKILKPWLNEQLKEQQNEQ